MIIKGKATNQDINILISRKKLEWIAHNFVVSEHAEYRMVQRDTISVRNLGMSILTSPLAWYSISGAVVIAFNLYEYIIVSITDNVPYVVTFANMKDRNATVIDKMFVDYKKKINETRK